MMRISRLFIKTYTQIVRVRPQAFCWAAEPDISVPTDQLEGWFGRGDDLGTRVAIGQLCAFPSWAEWTQCFLHPKLPGSFLSRSTFCVWLAHNSAWSLPLLHKRSNWGFAKGVQEKLSQLTITPFWPASKKSSIKLLEQV